MAEKKAGSLFAELALKGLDKLKSGLAEAAGAFASLRSTMLSTVSAAAPREFDDMRVAIFSLNLQIGRIFIPLLREVTGQIQQLGNWFRNLTDAQREQILNWVRIAAAVGTVATVLPTLVSAVSSASGVVYGLGLAFRFLGMSIPVAGLAAVVTVLGIVGLVMRQAASGSFNLTAALQSVMTALQNIWSALQPVISALISLSTSFLTAFIEVLTFLYRTIQQVIDALSFLADWFNAIASFLAPLVSLVSSIIGPWLRYAAAILAVIALAPAFMGFVALVVGGIRAIQAALTVLMANPIVAAIAAIIAVIGLLTGALGSTNSELGEMAARLGEIEQSTERLRAGAQVTRRDMEQLPHTVRAEIEGARTREERNRIVTREIGNLHPAAARSEQRRREAGQVESALADMPDLDWWTNRDRRGRRIRGIEERIGRSLTAEENTAVREAQPDTDRLTPAAITAVGNIFRTQAVRPEANIEILRAIRDRGLPGENFRGTMRQMPAEFTQITEQWRRFMTADTESPEARMRREQLAETAGVRSAAERAATAAEALAGRPATPAVAPG